MVETFHSISLNYKTAPVSVREAFALTSGESAQLLSRLKELFGIKEAMIVSTCVRTEIYYRAIENYNSQISGLIEHLKGKKGFLTYSNQLEGHDAVHHLWRMALGLESSVLGDLQITSQVKNAYQLTSDLDMAGAFLHRLMHAIFFTNKRLVQETSFRDGAASVPYAAVDLIKTLLPAGFNPSVLVIGTGKMGENTARNLQAMGFSDVTITNRTYDKAVSLATELEFKSIRYSNFKENISDFDVIVSAVSVKEPILSITDFPHDISDHRYLIDLSVPRAIHENVENNPALLLHNIDEIRTTTRKALEERKKAIYEVEKIIEESIRDFEAWSRDMEFSPTINKIKDALEHIRQDEMERYLKQLQLSDDEAEKIEIITKSMIQKILKFPVLQLKAACRRGDGEQLADVLNDLFDIEKSKKKV